MKALRLHGQDGRPEKLFYEEAPPPILEIGDALVRIHGCAITKSELTWTEVHRAADGSRRPFVIPGHEVSGVIESVASEAPHFKAGDEVYGLIDFYRDGGAAEFAAIRAADLALKPHTLDFAAAAAVPLAALTAWQGLFVHAQLTNADKIFIHGAAGGVGSFAVQFARLAGASVIATARGTDEEFLRGLGAGEVLDYEKVEFEEVVSQVDVVFDTVGGAALEKSWRVIRPGGILVTVHTPAPGENPVAQAAEYGVRGVMFIVEPNRSQLAEISRLIDAGQIKPVIDKIYPLAEGRAAFERVEGHHNRGKIVLQID